MRNLFKRLLISLPLCLAFFAVHGHAQNVSPLQIKWPTCAAGTAYSPNGNYCVSVTGSGVLYPAQCSGTGGPSWCSGSTPDAWIRAACSALPSTGGVVNFAGLTGNLTASTAGCSTPTRQVIFYQDPTSNLTVTENDGGVVFPLDNSSMLLGPGAGQCPLAGGIHLSSSANVTAIVGPAHVDGTQESFTAAGLCLYGATSATVSKGLAYAGHVYTNTQIINSNIVECNNACVWIEDVGGAATVAGNWMNVTDGNYNIIGSDLVVIASFDIDIFSNTMEHANGGASYPEVRITGDGAGTSSNSIWLHNDYVERNQLGTPDVNAVSITDCQSCSVRDIGGAGTVGGSNFVYVTQTANGRTQNVEIDNIETTAWTNVLNDTIADVTLPEASTYIAAHYVVSSGFSDSPCPVLANTPAFPYVGQCWTETADYRTNIDAPSGQQQYAWLSDVATLPHSVGADLMAGAGSFTTGSANFGTGFGSNGCQPAAGTTCSYTRTNSTAPAGYTYSQEVQITANTDTSTGLNGIQYNTLVAYTAGQAYIASFWAKGDGSFTGKPTFVLGDETVPSYYCEEGSGKNMTTSWQLYTFVCVPATSGSSYLQVVAATPSGATGTFYIAGFVVTPETTLSTGNFVGAVGPYGVSTNINGVSISVGAGAPTATCGTAPTASGSLWLRTDGGATTTLYVCAGTSWVAK